MAKVMSTKEEGGASFPNLPGGPLVLFSIDDYPKRLRHIVLISNRLRRTNPIEECALR